VQVGVHVLERVAKWVREEECVPDREEVGRGVRDCVSEPEAEGVRTAEAVSVPHRDREALCVPDHVP